MISARPSPPGTGVPPGRRACANPQLGHEGRNDLRPASSFDTHEKARRVGRVFSVSFPVSYTESWPNQFLLHSSNAPFSESVPRRRVLIFVDESNVTSSAKTANRKLDWLKLRDHLVKERELIEMVVYAGLPPAMPEWQAERDKKNKFLFWLRSNGFLVVEKDGSPADGSALQGERRCAHGHRWRGALQSDAARCGDPGHRRCRLRASRLATPATRHSGRSGLAGADLGIGTQDFGQ